MAPRRKYEDAAGVVPLHWVTGVPNVADRGTICVLEVWTLTYGHQRLGDVKVEARLCPARYDVERRAWVYLATGAPIVPSDSVQVRRSAPLAPVFTEVSLTLGDWNV